MFQNERRIAHLGEKLETHQGVMTERVAQQERIAQDRIQQGDHHIENMGAEHQNYHSAVLGCLDESGMAQIPLQRQLEEQNKIIMELKRGLKEARDAAEARFQAQAGVDNPRQSNPDHRIPAHDASGRHREGLEEVRGSGDDGQERVERIAIDAHSPSGKTVGGGEIGSSQRSQMCGGIDGKTADRAFTRLSTMRRGLAMRRRPSRSSRACGVVRRGLAPLMSRMVARASPRAEQGGDLNCQLRAVRHRCRWRSLTWQDIGVCGV